MRLTLTAGERTIVDLVLWERETTDEDVVSFEVGFAPPAGRECETEV